jgi:hypothetical protein
MMDAEFAEAPGARVVEPKMSATGATPDPRAPPSKARPSVALVKVAGAAPVF